MVVKLLDTVVTDGTVRAAGRPPMVACGAPLGLDHEAIDLVLFETRPRPAARTPWPLLLLLLLLLCIIMIVRCLHKLMMVFMLMVN